MFSKSHRFSFKKGAPRSIFQTSFYSIRYAVKRENGLECAVVIGKKVDKRATVRNRYKRLTTEVVKDLISLDTPYKIVLFVKKPILGLEVSAIREDIKKGFESIGITTWI